MNPRHCHLNLRKESQEAFALAAYRAPDLRKRWRTLVWNGVLVGIALVFGLAGYLATCPH
jgi:hypothetical protein